MQNSRLDPAPIESHETPFGTRHVAAAFDDEIWVSAVPMGSMPRTLTARPDLRPHSGTFVFSVLRGEDGSMDVRLRDNPRRRPPTMDAAFENAMTLATTYANDHSAYLDELRALQREERIADLREVLADTPSKSTRAYLDKLREASTRNMSQIPEHLRDLILRTEPTDRAMRIAPYPLGAAYSGKIPEDDMVRLVKQACRQLLVIGDLERDHAQRSDELRAQIAALVADAEADNVPSAPTPF